MLLFRSASLAGLLPLALAGLFYWRQAGALRNNMRWRSGGSSGSRPSSGQTSDVETAFLRMSLDHDTGETTGTVLRGRFAGAHLHELGFPELMIVLAEARVSDPQGAQLLEAYVSRVHPDAWEAASEAGEGEEPGRAAASGPMTRQQALDVLGLTDGATEDDIREAHRRLMRQVHPDRGGSGFLAAQINAARDILLDA